MKDSTTGAMQQYGGFSSPDNPHGARAAFVLLYSPHYQQFKPAYPLAERDVVIGRDPTAAICVPEAAVSRQHARIHFEPRGWVLTDLGSRNGTLVDGQFIHSLALEDLHEIRVGDAIFKFVAMGGEAYEHNRIDGVILGRPAFETVPRSPILGGCQIQRLVRAIERVARTEISVVLLGESGTGKEVFAGEVHRLSGRKGSFQAVNCAAIPATLLESELFGYKRGAFSGADRDKVGIVKAADGGTLFLDEIGDMPLEAQAKLLRVLQSKEIVPVGGTHAEQVDVRIVCATHRDLGQLQRESKFRGDLFARLNEYSVRLPPLRDRKEDIYGLTRGMLARHGRPDLGLSFAFMTGLLHYDWPFNVRELEASVKRAMALSDNRVLDSEHLPDVIKEHMKSYAQPRTQKEGRASQVDLQVTIEPVAKRGSTANPTEEELRSLLQVHRGNIAAVGREFGKERMQVHRWMKRFGINAEEYR